MKKLNKEEITKTFSNRGYIILDINQYKTNSSYMDFKDKEGYMYNYKYSNVYSGKNPRRFSKTNKYTIYNIKNYIKINNINAELLSDQYNGEKDLLKFKCGLCGKIFYRNWANFRDQEYKFCEECSIKERGKNSRINLDIVKNKFEEVKLKLLDENYTRNCDRLLCEDIYGYRGFVPYNHIERIKESSRNGFDYFSIKHNKENYIYNINNFCELNNIGTKAIKLLEEDNSYSKPTILFKCNCGEYFTTTVNSFKSGKQKCDKCSKVLSRYEFLISNFLDKYKIKYIRQKRFKDCKNVLPLPFDFYIENLNILLEIDGQGHFFPCNFNSCSNKLAEKSFKLTQYNDKIKTQYCENKNIELIRIPYWEFENNNYKEILFNNIINV